MIIKELLLNNYRNIEYLEINNISKDKNIIVGDNAQGKTNIIEAINYLSCAKSFRTVSENMLIRESYDSAYLKCSYKRTNGSGKIEAKLFKDKRKSISINGMPISRVSELLGTINTVVFAPEDMKVIKESPALRRHMIDIEISKIKPSYFIYLQQLYSLIKNKNKVLKDYLPDKTLIEVYNEEIVKLSEQIIRIRLEYINELSGIANRYHRELNNNEQLLLRYRCCCDINNIKEDLYRKLTDSYELEKEKRFCLVGPHKEDFDIIINGKQAKLYGSQGQQRTAMISIKLAVSELAYKKTGEYPILLLDDVFSELDTGRANSLFNAINNLQVFITAAEYRDSFKNQQCYFINNGKVQN